MPALGDELLDNGLRGVDDARVEPELEHAQHGREYRVAQEACQALWTKQTIGSPTLSGRQSYNAHNSKFRITNGKKHREDELTTFWFYKGIHECCTQHICMRTVASIHQCRRVVNTYA